MNAVSEPLSVEPLSRRDLPLLHARMMRLAITLLLGAIPVASPAAAAESWPVRPVRIVGVYSDPTLQVVRYPDGNVWHYVTTCFECKVLRGELTTCDETLALDYYPPARLPKTLLPNHRIRIRDARARRAAAAIH